MNCATVKNIFHWSFDYQCHQGNNDEFRITLIQALNSYTNSNKTDKNAEKAFTILPNYWRGYQRFDKALNEAGKILISRNNGNIAKGKYIDNLAGEETEFWYSCNESMEGEFGLRIKSLHKHEFAGIEYQGKIANKKLSIGIADKTPFIDAFVSGNVQSDWSLMDTFRVDTLTYFESMQTVYNEVKIKAFDTYTVEGLLLNGYVLYGTGVPLSYWWVDDNGQTVIVSKTFYTYVLTN